MGTKNLTCSTLEAKYIRTETSTASLVKHTPTPDTAGTFQYFGRTHLCVLCSKHFCRSDRLKAHIKNEHKDTTRNTCKFCQTGNGLITTDDVIKHPDYCTGLVDMRCRVCLHVFPNRASLLTHMEALHEEKSVSTNGTHQVSSSRPMSLLYPYSSSYNRINNIQEGGNKHSDTPNIKVEKSNSDIIAVEIDCGQRDNGQHTISCNTSELNDSVCVSGNGIIEASPTRMVSLLNSYSTCNTSGYKHSNSTTIKAEKSDSGILVVETDSAQRNDGQDMNYNMSHLKTTVRVSCNGICEAPSTRMVSLLNSSSGINSIQTCRDKRSDMPNIKAKQSNSDIGTIETDRSQRNDERTTSSNTSPVVTPTRDLGNGVRQAAFSKMVSLLDPHSVCNQSADKYSDAPKIKAYKSVNVKRDDSQNTISSTPQVKTSVCSLGNGIREAASPICESPPKRMVPLLNQHLICDESRDSQFSGIKKESSVSDFVAAEKDVSQRNEGQTTSSSNMSEVETAICLDNTHVINGTRGATTDDLPEREAELQPRKRLRINTDNDEKKTLSSTGTSEERHLPLVVKEEYPCILCMKCVKLRKSLPRHIMEVHKDIQQYRCAFCRTDINTVDDIMVHIDVCEGLADRRCAECFKLFVNNSHVIKHVTETHQATSSAESISDNEINAKKRNTGKEGHLPLVVKEEYPCVLCKKCVKFRKSLPRHIKEIHRDITQYECQFCHTDIGTVDDLSTHVDVCEGLTDRRCSECCKLFVNETHVIKHVTETHQATPSSEHESEDELQPRKRLRRSAKVDACERLSSAQTLNNDGDVESRDSDFSSYSDLSEQLSSSGDDWEETERVTSKVARDRKDKQRSMPIEHKENDEDRSSAKETDARTMFSATTDKMSVQQSSSGDGKGGTRRCSVTALESQTRDVIDADVEMEKADTNIKVIGKIPCVLCMTLFCKRSNIPRHFVDRHMGMSSNVCTYCDSGRDLNSVEDVVNHVQVCKGLADRRCNNCWRVFTDGAELKKHKDIRSRNRCMPQKAYRTGRGNGRLKNTTDDSNNKCISQGKETIDEMYHCILCNAFYAYLSDLKRHLRMMHSDVRKFTCKLCSYSGTLETILEFLWHLQTCASLDVVESELLDIPAGSPEKLESEVHQAVVHQEANEATKESPGQEIKVKEEIPDSDVETYPAFTGLGTGMHSARGLNISGHIVNTSEVPSFHLLGTSIKREPLHGDESIMQPCFVRLTRIDKVVDASPRQQKQATVNAPNNADLRCNVKLADDITNMGNRNGQTTMSNSLSTKPNGTRLNVKPTVVNGEVEVDPRTTRLKGKQNIEVGKSESKAKFKRCPKLKEKECKSKPKQEEPRGTKLNGELSSKLEVKRSPKQTDPRTTRSGGLGRFKKSKQRIFLYGEEGTFDRLFPYLQRSTWPCGSKIHKTAKPRALAEFYKCMNWNADHKCVLCQAYFTTFSDFIKHCIMRSPCSRKINKGKELHCPPCQRTFGSLKKFMLHMMWEEYHGSGIVCNIPKVDSKTYLRLFNTFWKNDLHMSHMMESRDTLSKPSSSNGEEAIKINERVPHDSDIGNGGDDDKAAVGDSHETTIDDQRTSPNTSDREAQGVQVSLPLGGHCATSQETTDQVDLSSTGHSATSHMETTPDQVDLSSTGHCATSHMETTTVQVDLSSTGHCATSHMETTPDQVDLSSTGHCATSHTETTPDQVDLSSTGHCATSHTETTTDQVDLSSTGHCATSHMETTPDQVDLSSTGHCATSHMDKEDEEVGLSTADHCSTMGTTYTESETRPTGLDREMLNNEGDRLLEGQCEINIGGTQNWSANCNSSNSNRGENSEVLHSSEGYSTKTNNACSWKPLGTNTSNIRSDQNTQLEAECINVSGVEVQSDDILEEGSSLNDSRKTADKIQDVNTARNEVACTAPNEHGENPSLLVTPPDCHEEGISSNSIPLHVRYRDVFLNAFLKSGVFKPGFECTVCQFSNQHVKIHRQAIQAISHVESFHTNERAKRKNRNDTEQTLCQFCGKYVRKYSIHLRDHHPKEAMSVLPKPCRGKQNLVRKCLYCPKVFDCSSGASKYHKHVRNHIRRTVPKKREDPVQCDVCGKFLATKYSYKTHMETHFKDQPPKYFCDKCPEKFNQYNQYLLHKKFHEHGRKFKCEQCDKTFLMKHHLKNHMLSHTDVMPFQCRHCDKRFRMKHHVEAHTKRVHGQ